MKKVKIPLIYGALSVLTGYLSGVERLAFLVLGLSLFIPPLFCLTQERNGIFVALSTTLVALGITCFFTDIKRAADFVSLPLVGWLICYIKEERIEKVLLLSSLFLFLSASAEDLFFGTPQLGEFSWFSNLKWGIYFGSSLFFSYLLMVSFSITFKRNFHLEEVNFGFFPVPLFLLGALGTLLLDNQLLKSLSENLTLASVSFFLVQGVSVFLYFYRNFSLFWKIISVVAFLIFPAGVILSSVLVGLLDLKLNFRKKRGGKKDEGNLA